MLKVKANDKRRFDGIEFSIGVFSLFLFLSLVAAGWPGWLSPDSYWMLEMAAGRWPVNDWHSPELVFFWSLLQPIDLGPTLLLVLQQACFWFGSFLIAIFLKRTLNEKWSFLFLALTAFLSPWTWLNNWIWKDSFQLSLVVLGTGVGVLASIEKKLERTPFLNVLMVVVFSFALIARPYMFVPVLLWLFSLFMMQKMIKRKALTLCVFSLGLCALIVLAIGKVQVVSQTFVAGHTMIYDSIRVECKLSQQNSEIKPTQIVNRDFLINLGSSNYCSDLDYLNSDRIIWPNDITTTYMRLPASEQELDVATSDWLELWTKYPKEMIQIKSSVLRALLTHRVTALQIPDSSVSTYSPGETSYGYVGDGNSRAESQEEIFPSRGGYFTKLSLMPMSVVRSISDFWFAPLLYVMFALIAATFLLISKAMRGFRIVIVSQMLAISTWFLIFSALTAAIDARYAMTGAWMATFSLFYSLMLMNRNHDKESIYS